MSNDLLPDFTPDWYKPQHYTGLSELDLIGWLKLLFIRCRYSIADDTEVASLMPIEQYIEGESINADLNNHIGDIDPIFKSTVTNLFGPVIEPINYTENDSGSALARALIESHKKSLEHITIPRGMAEWSVFVNIRAHKETIRRDFEKWLERLDQSELVYQRQFYQRQFYATLLQCINHRVLQYIDLNIWQRQNPDKHMTQYNMAQILFYDRYDINQVDKLRSQTKPRAEAILSASSIWAMHCEVMSEKWSKNEGEYAPD